MASACVTVAVCVTFPQASSYVGQSDHRCRMTLNTMQLEVLVEEVNMHVLFILCHPLIGCQTPVPFTDVY